MYPMLPVAISAYILSKAAGTLFCAIKNKKNYKIINLDLLVKSPSSPLLDKQVRVAYNAVDDSFLCSLENSENQETILKLNIS